MDFLKISQNNSVQKQLQINTTKNYLKKDIYLQKKKQQEITDKLKLK